mmetsp:Transcript_42524/g.117348  ORF Transcript_42524/g.117348 Transcript_42524/m.117348 type:complete len:226 (+) Transcript_42524:123-800(+)
MTVLGPATPRRAALVESPPQAKGATPNARRAPCRAAKLAVGRPAYPLPLKGLRRPSHFPPFASGLAASSDLGAADGLAGSSDAPVFSDPSASSDSTAGAGDSTSSAGLHTLSSAVCPRTQKPAISILHLSLVAQQHKNLSPSLICSSVGAFVLNDTSVSSNTLFVAALIATFSFSFASSMIFLEFVALVPHLQVYFDPLDVLVEAWYTAGSPLSHVSVPFAFSTR